MLDHSDTRCISSLFCVRFIECYLQRGTELVKYYIWSIAFYGADTWTLEKVDQKYLESFKMWCWRRMKKMT